ncbi:hypothetical protein [Bradyrhizobium mercantei]|uniref:hypothetical protein n=1 Tax=Bradyrhizobium mercantei TaxID=1904807 RepID=UPI0011774D4D|nr:hypothetical protein [Bradyrhizobium mercantei]
MAARTEGAGRSHADFKRAANDELTKFEHREREFQKEDRDERAKRLQLPVERYNREDWRVRKPSRPFYRA